MIAVGIVSVAKIVDSDQWSVNSKLKGGGKSAAYLNKKPSVINRQVDGYGFVGL